MKTTISSLVMCARPLAPRKTGCSTRLRDADLDHPPRRGSAGSGKIRRRLRARPAPGSLPDLGGETTVTLRGSGIGGRNTELALAAALACIQLRSASSPRWPPTVTTAPPAPPAASPLAVKLSSPEKNWGSPPPNFYTTMTATPFSTSCIPTTRLCSNRTDGNQCK
jgi:hypothetical protein